MQDKVVVPFLDAHEIFTKWIRGCTRMEQLYILNEIIENFISLKRFPSETLNSINIGIISLRLEIEEQMNKVKSIA